jgi:hypothetical protein
VLQLEYVSLKQLFQFIVFKSVSVEKAREAHLAMAAHRLHAVVHLGGGGQVEFNGDEDDPD